ncbi:MAG: GNAT family N-acetyltransferase [Anaerolineales bacterium]|nr:GNAT family N-acetyltransferase [Anaerolineales bacterium]
MIRLYRDDDFEVVTAFWYEAMHVAMPKMMKRMGFDLEGARSYFINAVIPDNQLWVYELDDKPVAFLGLEEDFIDRIYVDPNYHRRGIGQALLDLAKTLSPHHLWLYTHAANKMARAFFEKNNFIAENFGVSPAPESEPDVEYHWRRK